MFRAENQADTSVLETLKVGDMALVQYSPALGRETLIAEREVTKVTPTQLHIALQPDYAQVFDRRTGFSRGDGARSAIVDPTHPRTSTVLERTRTVQARNRLDYAIEAYRENNFDSPSVRAVISAATELAERLDVQL